jgi:hypothetical protein
MFLDTNKQTIEDSMLSQLFCFIIGKIRYIDRWRCHTYNMNFKGDIFFFHIYILLVNTEKQRKKKADEHRKRKVTKVSRNTRTLDRLECSFLNFKKKMKKLNKYYSQTYYCC